MGYAGTSVARSSIALHQHGLQWHRLHVLLSRYEQHVNSPLIQRR
jgi:hypothetical protein